MQLKHRFDARFERAELRSVSEQQIVVLLKPVRKLFEVPNLPANVAHRLEHDLLGVLFLRICTADELVDFFFRIFGQMLPFLVQLLELLADQIAKALPQLGQIVQVAFERIRTVERWCIATARIYEFGFFG